MIIRTVQPNNGLIETPGGVGFSLRRLSADAVWPVRVTPKGLAELPVNDSGTFMLGRKFDSLVIEGPLGAALPNTSQWEVTLFESREESRQGVRTVRVVNPTGGDALSNDSNGNLITSSGGSADLLASGVLQDADISALATRYAKAGGVGGVAAGAAGAYVVDASKYLGVLLVAEDGYSVNGGTSPTMQWGLAFFDPSFDTTQATAGVAGYRNGTTAQAIAPGNSRAVVNVNPYLAVGTGTRATGLGYRPQKVVPYWVVGGTAAPTGFSGTAFNWKLYGYR